MFRLAGVGVSEGRATAAARGAPMTSSASAGEGKRGNPFAAFRLAKKTTPRPSSPVNLALSGKLASPNPPPACSTCPAVGAFRKSKISAGCSPQAVLLALQGAWDSNPYSVAVIFLHTVGAHLVKARLTLRSPQITNQSLLL